MDEIEQETGSMDLSRDEKVDFFEDFDYILKSKRTSPVERNLNYIEPQRNISPVERNLDYIEPKRNSPVERNLDYIEPHRNSSPVERSIVSPHSDSETDQEDHTDKPKYAGMKSFKVGKVVEKEYEIEEEERKVQAVSTIEKIREVITPTETINRSYYTASPTLTEDTDQLRSIKGTAVSTPLPSRSKHSAGQSPVPLMTPVTVRSKKSGRLSPTAMSTPQPVSVGNQPVTMTRFNEPLKLRKGRHLVDYEIPGPTIVYVPHKRQTQGQWTNVTVQRKPNGRYVVMEQRPIYTRFTDASVGSKNKTGDDVFSSGNYKFTVKKSPWNWSTKGNFIERQSSKGFYEPYLPPIKSKYTGVESKIGSMDNYDHVPGGGTHKVPSFKLKWDAEPRIGSLPATGRTDASPVSHAYTEGNSLKLPEIVPRYGATADSGSFSSIHYSPGGSVFIRKNKNTSKSRVGSLDNASYKSYGGDVVIPKHKVSWKSGSKVGSLHNITHMPKNSNVQIFSEKLDWQTGAKIGSWDNADHKPKRKRFRVPHFNANWTKAAASRIGSMVNINHKPGGGHPQIVNEKVEWKGKSKIDSHWKFNFDYKGLFDNDFETDSESEFHEETLNTYSGTV